MRQFIGTCVFIATIAAAHPVCAAAGQEGLDTAADVPAQPKAAAPPADDGGVADIVVTAQRRSESLQKTALSISVIQPSAIANAGVTSPLQLTSLVPSLQVGNAGPATSVYLRGVGSYLSTAGQSPAIPYYIDGVYVARSQSVSSEFYDIDRLEVLKGPQGTLYGRNASGGAINVITRRPDLTKVSGNANLEIGNFGNQALDAALNLPLSSTLALRLSGTVVDKGGYTTQGFGDDVHQSIRAKLLWEPNETVSLLLNGSYGHIGGQGPAIVLLNRDAPGWTPWLDITDPRAQAYLVANSVFGPNPPPGFIRPVTKEDGVQNLDFYNISAELEVDLGGPTLTILPAFRSSNMVYTALVTNIYANGLPLGNGPARPETSDATSIEARISGEGDKLKYVLGVYFYNEDQFQQFSINAGFPINIGYITSFGTRSYAAFGQATYSLTPGLRLTGGLRYTSDKRSLGDGESYVLSPSVFLGPSPPSTVPCLFPFPTADKCLVDSFEGSRRDKNISWKAGFEADVLGNSLLYGTASRGFKAGGFNAQSVRGSPGVADPFDPEVLTAYELGIKNRLLDNRLQVNLTGFYWDYKDHQEPRTAFTDAGLINLIYNNAGTTEIYGGTLEVVARPWRGATISSTVEYVHSRYKDFIYTAFLNPAATGCRTTPSSIPGLFEVDCSGFSAVRTPQWTGNVNISQDIPLSTGKLVATGNLNFASSRYLSIDFTELQHAKAYATLDATLTYKAPTGWAVTGFVRNITNGVGYTSAVAAGLSSVVAANINSRRSYGARLSVEF